MGFSEEPLPKIFDIIIETIEENGGAITVEKFKQTLYSIRIEKQDINDIKKWLENQGIINAVPGHGRQKGTIELVKINNIF